MSLWRRRQRLLNNYHNDIAQNLIYGSRWNSRVFMSSTLWTVFFTRWEGLPCLSIPIGNWKFCEIWHTLVAKPSYTLCVKWLKEEVSDALFFSLYSDLLKENCWLWARQRVDPSFLRIRTYGASVNRLHWKQVSINNLWPGLFCQWIELCLKGEHRIILGRLFENRMSCSTT